MAQGSTSGSCGMCSVAVFLLWSFLTRCGLADKILRAAGWQQLATPWSAWKPCNESLEYTRACAPVMHSCAVELPPHDCQGIGASLTQKLFSDGIKVFKDNCTLILDRGTKCSFDWSAHFVNPPPLIPSIFGQECFIYALTQPPVHVAANLGRAGLEKSKLAPKIGLHLRTGWADWVLSSSMPRPGTPKIDELDCTEFEADATYLGATADLVGYREQSHWRNLNYILEQVIVAGDGAFGEQQWRLFLATDSPAVRRYVLGFVGSRVLEILQEDGVVGHSHESINRKVEPELIFSYGESAVRDLVALSETDILIHLTSTFSTAAIRRTGFCPKRHFEMRSTVRSHDTTKKVYRLTNLQRRTADFKDLMPTPSHPCLGADEPWLPCLCYGKLGLGGMPGISNLVKDEL